MPKATDDEDQPTIYATPPGPVDHGRDGGMATREIAPEVTERDD